MKLNDLDQKMRVYETAHDYCVPPGMYIVARLDGRGFTSLTNDQDLRLEKPFDERFHGCMTAAVDHLMTNTGFGISYGYTQSDEISLLFNLSDDTFGRKLRKINSVLAGEASAIFSYQISRICSFDCRISLLPNPELVIDYFRWRQADAHRNALNSWCYWTLRQKKGQTASEATRSLLGKTVAEKNELLFADCDINFNILPAWQKRGSGLYWESYDKEGLNPQTGETVIAQRRRIYTEEDLPFGDEYSLFLQRFLV